MKKIFIPFSIAIQLSFSPLFWRGVGGEAFSQSFQPTVIGSAGTYAAFANGSMAWTIGEVITPTFSSANNFFTQGFHQPEFLLTAAGEVQATSCISIYPNPVQEKIYVNSDGEFTLLVYNMYGERIMERNLFPGSNEMNIGNLSSGIYMLTVISQNGTKQSFKINHIK